jgi:hypothetical protein
MLRLFLAEQCLAAGVTPAALMKAQGLDRALAKYREDEPRVPAGHRRESGRWTSGGAGDGRIQVAVGGADDATALLIIHLLLEYARRSRSAGGAPGEATAAPETEPVPTLNPAEEGNFITDVKPFGSLESDLPRPGIGQDVSIPGLPDTIKGVDTTKPSATMANYKVDLSRAEFESELSQLGWTKEPSKDGLAMNYLKDGAKYSVRDDAKSTEGPTADFYHPQTNGESIDMKLRLRGK